MKNMNIKDIAKLAGVGIGTVSRVINNHPDVKDETREHVLRVIEKYNYIPNSSARYLKKTESNDIGILIKGIHNPLFAKMVERIETILSKHTYRVVLHHQIEDHLDDIAVARTFVKEKKLKGLICLGGDFEKLENEVLKTFNVPLILSSKVDDSALDESLYSSIGIDNSSAAYKAVQYLIDLGHQKIGVISSGEGDRAVGGKRIEGYLKALSQNNIEKVERYFELSDYSFDSAYKAMKRLMDKSGDITAVFAISDRMAIGAAKAIRDSGKEVPRDISIIGFDDIDFAAYFNPPLTTVHQPIDEISEEMSYLILKLIDDQIGHQHIEYDTTLVRRASVEVLGLNEDKGGQNG